MIEPPSLENALVTGASGTIGRAAVRALAAAGFGVVLAARDVAACRALASELRSGGARALAVELDVTDHASIAGALAEARQFGPLELLVNNAGIAESAPSIPSAGEAADPEAQAASQARYARHLAVNFHGPRLLAEALVPEMLARGRGAVVNVASSAGLRGYAYVAAYCASKHALVGWTRAAALELAPRGLGVHAVCPHYVDSAMTERTIENISAKTGRAPAEARAWLASENPGGRLVRPEEVAATIVALAGCGPGGRVVELDGATARDVTPLAGGER